MEVLGIGMLIGPLLAGSVGAGLNATNGINDACNSLKSAQDNYNSTKDKWTKALLGVETATDKLELNIEQLNSNYQGYKTALRDQVKAYKVKHFTQQIFIALFIFIIILTLAFKYFDIYGQIFRLFGI